MQHKFLLFFVLAFTLSGCFIRQDVKSHIYLSSELSRENLSTILSKVKESIVNFGGVCADYESESYICKFPNFPSTPYIWVSSAGLREDGKRQIRIISEITSIFPKSEQSIIEGKIIPKRHKVLEKLVLDIVPSDVVVRRQRTYSGTSFQKDF